MRLFTDSEFQVATLESLEIAKELTNDELREILEMNSFKEFGIQCHMKVLAGWLEPGSDFTMPKPIATILISALLIGIKLGRSQATKELIERK